MSSAVWMHYKIYLLHQTQFPIVILFPLHEQLPLVTSEPKVRAGNAMLLFVYVVYV